MDKQLLRILLTALELVENLLKEERGRTDD